MPMQTVRDVMTSHVVTLPRETTLAEAARTMREQDIGDIVVSDGAGPDGLVTDRDIVVRAVAEQRDPATTTIGEILTPDLVTVRPDDTVQSAALLMRDYAVRRVLVCEEDQTLVGIVSIGDLAEAIDPESVLGGISRAAPNN
ncbi:CBS domain-containing protein [Planosporangium flavigriseum]|uniref:Oxidoreductase n=2 Tax=Planosporangium flavigriseum TaxID=373681 RepID=A0A8J3PKE9_9ACTN|nr:oxidoreductase [Planosporangium flavigriseum]